jgi:hypothetical protein
MISYAIHISISVLSLMTGAHEFGLLQKSGNITCIYFLTHVGDAFS